MDLSFLWDINFFLFQFIGYKVSLIELVGTITGLLSVWYGAKNNIRIWYLGFINVIAFGIIFFQINLYADMLLQVFYFIATVYGLYKWNDKTNEDGAIQLLSSKEYLVSAIAMIQLFLLLSWFTRYFPHLFEAQKIPFSSYPIIDSFLSAASVIATILMARRKLESWIMWIAIDAASVLLYLKKEVFLIAIEFGVFTALAVYGFISWKKLKIESDFHHNTSI